MSLNPAVQIDDSTVEDSATEGKGPEIPEIHTLHFNITNTCNLECSFCYIDAQQEATHEIPLEMIENLAKDFKKAGGKKVILSGGEPFVRKDWEDVFQIWADHDLLLSVVSNGTQLPRSHMIDKLKQFPELTFLISLDGAEETHELIRGVEGSYERTVEAIRLLKEADIPVQVNCTICKTNYDDVKELTKLSRDLGVSLRFSVLNPYNGRGTEYAENALSPEKLLELRDYCHVARKLGSDVFLNLPPLLQHPDDVLPIRSPACGWTKSYCGVLHNGDVAICGVAGDAEELVAGNLYEQSFSEIWSQSPLFNRLKSLNTQDLKGICSVCPYRETCGGACRLSAHKRYNDMLAPYPLCQGFYEDGLIPDHLLEGQIDDEDLQFDSMVSNHTVPTGDLGGSDNSKVMTLALTTNAAKSLANMRAVVSDARKWTKRCGIVGEESSLDEISDVALDFHIDSESSLERLTNMRQEAEFHSERMVIVGDEEVDRQVAESAGWEFIPLKEAGEKAGWNLNIV